MHLELIRDTARADSILGTLIVGSAVLQTIELPWIPDLTRPGGKSMVSCIPVGDYRLVRHDTPKHPHTFAFYAPNLGVYHEAAEIPAGCSGRTVCLLHPDNIAATLEGCCGVGRTRTVINGVAFVTDSRAAFADFQALVPWMDGHTVSIVDATGPKH